MVTNQCTTNVNFPIGLLLRDCGEMHLYASIAELEEGLEPIDVENNEYAGWDYENYPINLFITTHYGATGWLGIQRSSSIAEPEQFLAAVLAFARSETITLDSSATSSPIELLKQLEAAIEMRPRRLKWWQRLLDATLRK